VLLLFREAYHFIESGETAKDGLTDTITSFPFSLSYLIGNVNGANGEYANQSIRSHYWIYRINAVNAVNNLRFDTRTGTQETNRAYNGFSVRL